MWFLLVFVGHWYGSLFCQTFFLHRYAAHRMVTMPKFWERFFYLMTFMAQGSSFLNPRAYAVLHRLHHAYSDTPKDPHSPRHDKNLFTMMLRTYRRYDEIVRRAHKEDKVAAGYVPEWPFLDKLTNKWYTLLSFAALYTGIYVAFAPSPWFYLLIPVHLGMGPIHGAIVNWAGHRYGYTNFKQDDDSRNTLPWDFLSLGELFQNNHHYDAAAVNFAKKRFEFDPTFLMIRVLALLGIVGIRHTEPREESENRSVVTPAPATTDYTAVPENASGSSQAVSSKSVSLEAEISQK